MSNRRKNPHLQLHKFKKTEWWWHSQRFLGKPNSPTLNGFKKRLSRHLKILFKWVIHDWKNLLDTHRQKLIECIFGLVVTSKIKENMSMWEAVHYCLILWLNFWVRWMHEVSRFSKNTVEDRFGFFDDLSVNSRLVIIKAKRELLVTSRIHYQINLVFKTFCEE